MITRKELLQLEPTELKLYLYMIICKGNESLFEFYNYRLIQSDLCMTHYILLKSIEGLEDKKLIKDVNNKRVFEVVNHPTLLFK
jgi:hypothetical protein